MIYVDALRAVVSRGARARRAGAPHGHRWCHMLADSNEELLAFASRLGLKAEWFQGDHFDLLPARREHALRLGAVEVTSRELVRIRRRNRTRNA